MAIRIGCKAFDYRELLNVDEVARAVRPYAFRGRDSPLGTLFPLNP
jgi:hypothetical protein